ncbi:MAG: DNA adenine methylase [Clostridia bacterium]|nr:DNA adenine methylase [Clostridia bacterium]
MKASMYTTKYILDEFGITRQTLYNWIKNNEISQPETDWRGWRQWSNKNVGEIKRLIDNKKESADKAKQANEDERELYINNRRYLGSKHKLLPFIESTINEECKKYNSFADIFAGTGVVGGHFNTPKRKIIVNDLLYSNYLAYLTWFSDMEYSKDKINKYIEQLNNIKPYKENYVSENFGNSYFSYENALKIGAVREEIKGLQDAGLINARENAILVTSLIYAMDKVANTCGHYDAYRRSMDMLQPLRLIVPHIYDEANKNNEIYNTDTNILVRAIRPDVTYIDPPYNSRQYSDSYHLLENIATWNKPKVEGVAKKMLDRSHIKSSYCTSRAPQAFKDLVDNINSKYIVVSYNNMAQKGNGRSNAKISDEEILEILKLRGRVKVFDTDFKYFTAGKTNLTDHKERIFLCKCR